MASNSLKSHSATTKTVKHQGEYVQRGGTLPPGTYHCQYIENHAIFGECVRLIAQSNAAAIHSPFASTPIVHSRGGFYIHGRGPHGSDGCLVPLHNQERIQLNHAIRDYPGTVVLRVVNVAYALPSDNVSGVVS